MFLKESSADNDLKIHTKMLAVDNNFSKAVDFTKLCLHHDCFPVNFLEIFRTAFQWKTRPVFSQFFNLRGSLENVKEKATRKTFFSREMKRLAPRIHLKKFC